MNDHYRARPAEPGPACEDFAPLLPLVAQQGLDSRDSTRLRQHLATCDYCQSELDSYNRLDDALARHFGPAPSGPLSPADIQELTSPTYHPNTPLPEAPPAPAGDAPRPNRSGPLVLPPRQQGAPHRLRLISILSAAAAVLLIASVSLALFKSHQPTQTTAATPQATATSQATPSPQAPGTLPIFSD
jgi:Putative zinc-finger